MFRKSFIFEMIKIEIPKSRPTAGVVLQRLNPCKTQIQNHILRRSEAMNFQSGTEICRKQIDFSVCVESLTEEGIARNFCPFGYDGAFFKVRFNKCPISAI